MSMLLTAGKKWRIPWMIALILVSFAAGAQQKVSGRITEKKTGNPLPGVTVKEKGVPNSLSTKEDGTFTLQLRTAKPVLEISFVGYARQEITVNGRASVEIILEEDTKGMEDVVVIGYQNVQRRKTTAAISTVKGKDIENIPYPTFDQMLQGRAAGLNILSVSGEPGANNIVNIRGNTSVSNSDGSIGANGISTPLYVIDGIAYDVSDVRSAYGNANPLLAINPNDIESVDILKDASAAAIYGARAGNGVIMIKTKRPKTGRPQFRVSSYVGISTRPAMKPVLVGAAERQYKMNLLRQQGTYENQGQVSQFLTDSLNPAFNNNTDWQGLFLQDAVIKNFDLNIGGAEERFAYRISMNRYEEEGIMRGFTLSRTTPRLFLSVKPYKGIEVTTDLYIGFTKAKHGPGNLNSIYPFTVSNFPSSFWRIDDQVRANYEGRNDKVRDDDRTTSLNGNTRLIATLTPELTFTSSLSYNFGFARRDYLRHRSVTTNNRSDAINYSSNSRRWEIENYVTYTKEIKDHTITALIGQGAEEQVNNVTSAQGNGVPFDAIQVIQGIPNGPNLSVTTSYEDRSRVSAFARVGYDYKGRYGIDGSFRTDASSRYSANSRWGTFPAVSARWNISEEPLWDKIKDIVSFMKIRGSYGITGRDPGNYYAQYRQLSTDVRYASSTLGSGASGNVITYNGVTAVTPNYAIPAPAANITWERSPQLNVGFDANFLRDRITLTMDYYVKDSRELVFNIPVPITTGYTTASNNYVDVRNKGLEVTLTTQNTGPRSPLKWSTTLNIAFNDNLVTKLPGNNRDFVYGPAWLQRTLTIGQPMYGFLVWNVPSVYASIDDVPVDPLTGQRIRWMGGNFFGAGDGAKQDVNGDYNIDNLDKVYIGNPQTKLYGGIINSFSYKNFTVQVLCTFVSGRTLWNGYLSDKLASAGNDVVNRWGPYSGPASDFGDLEFWRKTGDNAYFPSLFTNNVDKWHIAQTIFTEDASFFRMKNINIGYTMPQKIAQKLRLRNIRLYSIIDNVFVLHNATVPDPELVSPDGYTNGNDYPLPKKFTFGLELNF
ncbi:MAG: SusC/RagA family TonB-linked outer membrane protein [Niastella sp.]|nr:SusC/RagA family TonB-linked outer membrane protein [Niastella sp.]